MGKMAQGIVTVLGRVMLATIFFMSAIGNKIPSFSNVVKMMEGEGVPMASVMLAGAIVFLIAGSLSVATGFKARVGASLLLVFLLLATYFFHDFWAISPDAMWVHSLDDSVKLPVQVVEMISFMKNMALMGAMLMIIANGSGPMSLDRALTGSKTGDE